MASHIGTIREMVCSQSYRVAEEGVIDIGRAGVTNHRSRFPRNTASKVIDLLDIKQCFKVRAVDIS
jgi:hypothetical protein